MNKIFLIILALILTACTPQVTVIPTAASLPPTQVPPTSPPTTIPTSTTEPTLTPEPLTVDKLTAMSDDEKLKLMLDNNPEYATMDNFCSQEVPNICVVDTGTDYLLYDLLQEKFVDETETGLAILRFSEAGLAIRKDTTKTYQEVKILVGNEAAENFILGDEGSNILSSKDFEKNPDGWFLFATFWQAKTFQDFEYPEGGKWESFTFKSSSMEASSWINGRETVFNGDLYTRLIYMDKNGEIKCVFVSDFIW